MNPLPTPRDLFAHYAQQRRTASFAGFTCEPLPRLTRYIPTSHDREGTVLFARLAPSDVDAAISEQLAFFTARNLPLEWKHHDFDEPPELPAALVRHGFVPGVAEALMLFSTASHRSRPTLPEVTIERVTTAEGIHAMVEVQQEVWGERLPWLACSLLDQLETSALFLARAAGRPVGTGWIEFVPHSDVADLHGGAVLSGFRGRGIYSALFDHRVGEARQRGVPYLAVDASPMSRPILLGQGFQFVCQTTPYRFRPPLLNPSPAPPP